MVLKRRSAASCIDRHGRQQFAQHMRRTLIEFEIGSAAELGDFTKGSFGGCDVEMESLISETTRKELAAMGHDVRVVAPRSGTFGFGQAVMSNGTGAHFAGSEPRTDGAAIPQAAMIKK